jgi:hypothetical protein
MLVLPEGTSLLENRVHEGGLAMIDVRDNGDITNILFPAHLLR